MKTLRVWLRYFDNGKRGLRYSEEKKKVVADMDMGWGYDVGMELIFCSRRARLYEIANQKYGTSNIQKATIKDWKLVEKLEKGAESPFFCLCDGEEAGYKNI